MFQSNCSKVYFQLSYARKLLWQRFLRNTLVLLVFVGNAGENIFKIIKGQGLGSNISLVAFFACENW